MLPSDSFPRSAANDSPADANQGFTRRRFIQNLGTAGVAASAANLATSVAQAAKESRSAPPAGSVPVTLNVNGTKHEVAIDPRSTLLDALREPLQLTGTKKGCDHGQCGACTIHINGQRTNSCLCLALAHE